MLNIWREKVFVPIALMFWENYEIIVQLLQFSEKLYN